MKAIRKSDGKVIEVTEKSSWNKEKIYTADGIFYRKEDLDFNVEEAEEVTIDGWVARDKCGNVFLYPTEPYFGKEEWQEIKQEYISIPDEFPNLTWKNEPIKVTITIKPKKKQ